MKYKILQLITGRKNYIEIDKEKYLFLKLANYILGEIYFIEEKFDIVIENYFEYEKNLLDISAKYMIYQYDDYHSLHNMTNTFNRHIINMLSSCKLYIDQIPHHIRNIYKDDTEKTKIVKKLFTDEYDSQISYRLFNALRNYVQHRGYPIQKLTFTEELISSKEPREIQISITPFINVSILSQDEKFKKAILQDFDEHKEEINIKLFLREYISCFGRIHNKIRALLNEDCGLYFTEYQNIINEFKERFSDTVGLSIAIEDDDGNFPDHEEIFIDFIERIQGLRNKNSRLDSIHLRFVTGQSI